MQTAESTERQPLARPPSSPNASVRQSDCGAHKKRASPLVARLLTDDTTAVHNYATQAAGKKTADNTHSTPTRCATRVYTSGRPAGWRPSDRMPLHTRRFLRPLCAADINNVRLCDDAAVWHPANQSRIHPTSTTSQKTHAHCVPLLIMFTFLPVRYFSRQLLFLPTTITHLSIHRRIAAAALSRHCTRSSLYSTIVSDWRLCVFVDRDHSW